MKIFISAVSSQFKACRNALRGDLSAVVAIVGDGYCYEPDRIFGSAFRLAGRYARFSMNSVERMS